MDAFLKTGKVGGANKKENVDPSTRKALNDEKRRALMPWVEK